MVRRLFALKAVVKADSIRKRPSKQHATNSHNATTYNANGNVVVDIKQQYVNNTGNEERPSPGESFYGDSAVITARKRHYDGPDDEPRRRKNIFSGNVTIDLKTGSKNSVVSSTKNGSYQKRRRKE